MSYTDDVDSRIVDLIAEAIYETHDVELFSLEDLDGGLDHYRGEACSVINALREAGIDLSQYDVMVPPPQPPVRLVPKSVTPVTSTWIDSRNLPKGTTATDGPGNPVHLDPFVTD